MGFEEKSDDEVVKMLKKAIKNSERKEYHNKFEAIQMLEALKVDKKKSSLNSQESISKLPSSEEQFRKLWEKLPNYGRFIHVTAHKEG